ITAAAGFGTAGVLTGTVYLSGIALLEFASGGITGIAQGATLDEETGSGFVALAGATGSNSALTGLSSNAGTIELEYGASITTTAGTNLTNTGTVDVDSFDPGGRSLTVGGALTNSGVLNIGNSGISHAGDVTAAGLVNTGAINVRGNNNSGGAQATLDITAAAGFGTPGVLSGTVYLSG